MPAPGSDLATPHASLLLLPQPDMQLAQLLFVDRVRRMGEQALRALGLGKSNHITDRFRPHHHRDNAVEPERNAAVRRRAVLQRLEQKTELGFGLTRSDI